MAWTNVPGSDAMEWQPDAASYGGLLGGLSGQDKTLALGLLGLGMLGGNYGRNKREAMANAFQGGMQGGLTGLNMATQAAAQQRRLGLEERQIKNMEETSALTRQQMEEAIRRQKAYEALIPSLIPGLTGQQPGGVPQPPAPAPTLGGGVQARIGGEGFNPLQRSGMGLNPAAVPSEQAPSPVAQMPTAGAPPVIDPKYSSLLALSLARGPEGMGNLMELAKMSKPGSIVQIDNGNTITLLDQDTRKVIGTMPKTQTPDSSARLDWDKYQFGNLSANQQNQAALDRWKALTGTSIDASRLGVDQARLQLDTPTGMRVGGGINIPPLPPMVGVPNQASSGPATVPPPPATPGAVAASRPVPAPPVPRPAVAPAPVGAPQIPLGVSPKDYSQAVASGETKVQSGLGQKADEVFSAADTGRSMIGQVNAMRQAYNALQQNGGNTGALANFQTNATALAQAFGVNPSALGLPKDAGPFQMMDAITNRLAVNMIGPGGIPANNFSEGDRKFVVGMMSSKTDTPTAFNQKLNMLEQVSQRAQQAEQFLLAGRQQGKSLETIRGEWTKYVNANPLFAQGLPQSGLPTQAGTMRNGVWRNGRIVYENQ